MIKAIRADIRANNDIIDFSDFIYENSLDTSDAWWSCHSLFTEYDNAEEMTRNFEKECEDWSKDCGIHVELIRIYHETI